MAFESIVGDLAGIGKGIGDVFINLSAEYPVILDGILFVVAGFGVIISGTACFEVIKMGRRDSVSYSPSAAIWWKLVGGVSLIDLAFWAKVWTDSLWSLSDPLELSGYAAAQGEDYSKAAIMAALGIVVIAGYVVLARAYFATTRLGYLSPEARSDVITGIASRIITGSMMIACLHISSAFDESTGFNWLPV
ncbi:hypothetical protein VQ574_21365 (plasmid) [Stutzerimonas frequens]|uniref:hypothetical protein n=1 Tax=Stutzerimonas frequens TaxID=2968969 RepID=UPI002DB699A7|nr:hypothetical protein [Stutzerimonas frequens]WRW29276.1 hypothetical protein VQ574_21365 [Stutzerimonas frequens]